MPSQETIRVDGMADRDGRTWGQAKRFEFMEWRLFWLDRLNRRDLEDEFGISTPQASIDLRNYQEAAPGNLSYDLTAKSYVRSERFEPKFLKPSGDRFLLQMRALRTGAIELSDAWFPQIPAVDVLPKLSRAVPLDLIRTISSAISKKKGVIIEYKSLKKGSNRIIGPHALAYDGHRWHIRAWCFERRQFRDFLFTRIAHASEVERVDYDANDDLEWNRYIKLTLRAHPGLDIYQKETIELDFGMENGCLEVEMRMAMAFYFIKRNNLDIDVLDAERQQFILDNREQVESEMAATREEAIARHASGG